MLDTHLLPGGAPALRQRERQDNTSFMAWYLLCAMASLVVGLLAYRSAGQFSLALVLLLFGIVIAIYRPVVGLYLVAGFGVAGDAVTSGWYPFTKNFSSIESILYVSDQLIVSPFEVFLVALLLGWLLRMYATHRWTVRRGRLFWPVMAFAGFMVMGLVLGLSRGGNVNVALWEFRPLMYIPLMYILATNLLDRWEQYSRLLWAVVAAVFITGVVAYFEIQTLDTLQKEAVESLVAHGVTLPMNLLFILALASWFFRSGSLAKRWLLPLLSLPVVVVYLLTQRRAAFVGLMAAGIMFAVVLFWQNRRAFVRVMPVVLVIGGLYLGAFWNTQGSLGFPARAVKSVVAPDQLSERDQSSDVYRVLETVDVLSTIQSSKWTGLGFGHAFFRPVALPGINAFLLADYVPHNSALWVWIKAGIGGFVAMLFLFGTALREGARNILRSEGGDEATITFAFTAFVLMYAMYVYVDIGWDPQNMLLLGLAFAHIEWAQRRLDRAPAPVAPTEDRDAKLPEALALVPSPRRELAQVPSSRREFAQVASRGAAGDAMGWDVLRDDAAGRDDGAGTDRHAWQHGHPSPEPDTVAEANRSAGEGPSPMVGWADVVRRREQHDVGAAGHAVADLDDVAELEGETDVEEAVVADDEPFLDSPAAEDAGERGEEDPVADAEADEPEEGGSGPATGTDGDEGTSEPGQREPGPYVRQLFAGDDEAPVDEAHAPSLVRRIAVTAFATVRAYVVTSWRRVAVARAARPSSSR